MDNVIVNEYTELLEKKARLQKGLSVLPQGYISKKNINGKTYHYLQNRVSGKMVGTYLKKNEVDRVSEQKERCISFADAMNAVEGVPASEQTAKGLADWQNGKTSYLSVFEATLRRYGFGAEV